MQAYERKWHSKCKARQQPTAARTESCSCVTLHPSGCGAPLTGRVSTTMAFSALVAHGSPLQLGAWSTDRALSAGAGHAPHRN